MIDAHILWAASSNICCQSCNFLFHTFFFLSQKHGFMIWYNSTVRTSEMKIMVTVFPQLVFQKNSFNLQIKNNYLWTYTVLIKTHLNLYFVPLDNSAVSVCVTGKCPILFLLMNINYKGQYKLKGKATSVLLAVNES